MVTQDAGMIAFAGSEVWLVDLAAAAPALDEIESETPRLADDDLAKWDRLADPVARRERRAAHIALRIAIERAFGPDWRGISYAVSKSGKPSLGGGAPGAFSLAHVSGLALLGITSRGTIGVDLERLRPLNMSDDRRRRIIEAAAALVPAGTLPAEGEAQFLQAWARLEAVAKARGSGIGVLLTGLGALGGASGRAADQRSGGASSETSSVTKDRAGDGRRTKPGRAPREQLHDLMVSDLDAGPDLYAAVAISMRDDVPALRSFPASAAGIRQFTRLAASSHGR